MGLFSTTTEDFSIKVLSCKALSLPNVLTDGASTLKFVILFISLGLGYYFWDGSTFTTWISFTTTFSYSFDMFVVFWRAAIPFSLSPYLSILFWMSLTLKMDGCDWLALKLLLVLTLDLEALLEASRFISSLVSSTVMATPHPISSIRKVIISNRNKCTFRQKYALLRIGDD